MTVELIQRICVLIEYCVLQMFDTLYMHIVWEEIGDVLHGLREDRGWTLKPIWEEIGDGLH